MMETLIKRVLAGLACPVQCVIFDVDGTLYDQSALRRRIIPRIAAAYCTRPATGLRVIRALQAYRAAHEQLRNQAFSSDLQIAAAARQCGETSENVRAIVEEWFERAPLALLPSCTYPGLAELLQLLTGNEIRCGVFSDYPAEAKLQAMGLRQYFSEVVCAADVARQKPDPAGIRAVAKLMGAAPGRTLYVGDRTIDLEAAFRAGMQGVLVRSGNSYSILRDRFAEYGVMPHFETAAA